MNRALLDVNVLIALFSPGHVHHETAHDWFADHRHHGWATCPLTENGFLRVAMQQKPDVVYLLTDGDFPNNNAVLEEIRKLNAGTKKVKINTIAFVNEKDTDEDFKELLQKIATESGGAFRQVKEYELNQ